MVIKIDISFKSEDEEYLHCILGLKENGLSFKDFFIGAVKAYRDGKFDFKKVMIEDYGMKAVYADDPLYDRCEFVPSPLDRGNPPLIDE